MLDLAVGSVFGATEARLWVKVAADALVEGTGPGHLPHTGW